MQRPDWDRFRSSVSHFFQTIQQQLAALIGNVSWSPPPWWNRLRTRFFSPERKQQILTAWSKTSAWVQTHRRPLTIWSGVFAVALLAAVAGYIWYQSLPKPVELSVSGSAPSATPLIDNARPEPIRINFSGSAARLDQVDKIVTSGIQITPPIAGEWRWNGDASLGFTPKEDWAVGQNYVVKLDPVLFPDHIRLKRYEYRFSSAAFTASISSVEFYQDPKNQKLKKIIATVRFSHPVDSADFEKRVALRMAGEKAGFLGFGSSSYPYTVSYNKFKGEAYIHSDPVKIPEKDSSMTLVIDSGLRSERGGNTTNDKLESAVAIPGMYNFFRIQSAQLSLVRNERYEPEQVLVLNTTDGIQEETLQKAMKAYILPRDLPATPGQPERKNHHWYHGAQIGPEVLALAKVLELKPLPTDKEYATLHSFKYQAEPGQFIYIKVEKGIQSAGGYILAKVFDAVQRVPAFPQELNIMYDGAILSLSGEKKVTVVARDIQAVRFEIGRVLPGQINHLVTQSGGTFRDPQFNSYQFGEDNVSEHFSEARELQALEHGKSQYASFDLTPYLSVGGARRGLFFFKVESWDTKNKRSLGKNDARLLLVTDLGLIVKNNADGSHDVFVQSIATGRPVAGARVEVLGKNGLAIVSDTTDADGHANLPKLKDFKREKTPVVYVVRHADDLAFLPFDRSDRQLNFSRFDIGGETSSQAGERLTAYLFSDRGIYRPGDAIHVGYIVKSQSWQDALAGVPIETVVTDARGLEVQRRKHNLSASGFEEILFQPEETAPTGNYQFAVYIVKDNRRASLLGSTSVRVEEFLPDRLKISTHFSQERAEGWVSPLALKGSVQLMNLFGTPATNRRISASVTLSPAFPAFRQYADYHFVDPLHAKNSFTDRLQDQQSDGKGSAEFDLNLERFDKATYRLRFAAEGFEAEGGRSVVSESSILVSPLAYLIGYKPDGDLRYVTRGAARTVELIAVDSALKKVPVSQLKAQLLELRYVSVLTQQSNGTYKYESVRKEISVSTRTLNIQAAGYRYALPTDKPGEFALVVRNAEDIELNRIEFSVAGMGNITRSLDKNAELQVKLNKLDFAAGEEIEVSITAPYTGAGLITIERERVYTQQWFKTSTTSSVHRIRVPASLEGNGYVNVSFVRAMDSPEIFMSPLSYGVAPFSVSRERRVNAITLETPELARPGENFRIRYRTQRPARIAVFAVDEGILQVAKYTTPDPLAHFFRKRALEVQTSQILDLILPEFRLIQALSAPGGDGEAGEAIGKNLNPFKRRRDKPVAYWSGIVQADSTSRELTFRVPDHFNGTMRVMAVAVSADAVGVAQKSATVRGHFVLSPNVPTTVAPGDEFEVSVGLANNVEGSGTSPDIKLDLAVSEHLQVLGSVQQTLKIGARQEGVATFKLRAKALLGSATLTFSAALGDKRSRYVIDASVRPPLPYLTSVATGQVKSGKADVPVTRRMYPHFRKLEASASYLPLTMARGLNDYLQKFPYGCTEQLVSQAFPAIVLRARPEFGYAPEKVEIALERTIAVLRARQNAEGAFGFWAANSHVSDMQAVYAMHFLTEAKERSYAVPPDMLTKGLAYLRSLAERDSDSLSQARVRAYAVYVLTRNGTVTTNFLVPLRKELEDKFAKQWSTDLAAAYLASSYQLLKQQSPAESLMGDLKLGVTVVPDYAYFYDGLVRDAQLLYLLARHFPERVKKIKGDDLQALVKPVSQGHYNTLSSAYTILALDAYAANIALPEAAALSLSQLLPGNKEQPLVLPKGLFPKIDFAPEAEKLRIATGSDFTVFYQVTQAGFDLNPPTQEIKQRLEVQREYRDASGSVVTQATLGTELEVRVKLRSLDNSTLPNVAIVDLLPGGFEVVMDSLPRSGHAGWAPEYVDIREDRVVLFGSVDPTVREFSYRIKATNKGQFQIPPVFAESMYDRTVQARGLGAKMTVDGK